MDRECRVSIRKAENGYVVETTMVAGDWANCKQQVFVWLKLQDAIENATTAVREIAPLVLLGRDGEED